MIAQRCAGARPRDPGRDPKTRAPRATVQGFALRPELSRASRPGLHRPGLQRSDCVDADFFVRYRIGVHVRGGADVGAAGASGAAGAAGAIANDSAGKLSATVGAACANGAAAGAAGRASAAGAAGTLVSENDPGGTPDCGTLNAGAPAGGTPAGAPAGGTAPRGAAAVGIPRSGSETWLSGAAENDNRSTTGTSDAWIAGTCSSTSAGIAMF